MPIWWVCIILFTFVHLDISPEPRLSAACHFMLSITNIMLALVLQLMQLARLVGTEFRIGSAYIELGMLTVGVAPLSNSKDMSFGGALAVRGLPFLDLGRLKPRLGRLPEYRETIVFGSMVVVVVALLAHIQLLVGLFSITSQYR